MNLTTNPLYSHLGEVPIIIYSNNQIEAMTAAELNELEKRDAPEASLTPKAPIDNRISRLLALGLACNPEAPMSPPVGFDPAKPLRKADTSPAAMEEQRAAFALGRSRAASRSDSRDGFRSPSPLPSFSETDV